MVHKGVVGTTACLIFLCLLAASSALSQTPAQDQKPETATPEPTSLGEYTFWGGGPDSSFTSTSLTAPDGSNMMIFDFISFKSNKSIKELLNNCTKDAVRLVYNKPGPTVKGARPRTLAIFRDNTGRESAVLCRSDGKHMLTKISGSTVENVLGLERSQYPKK